MIFHKKIFFLKFTIIIILIKSVLKKAKYLKITNEILNKKLEYSDCNNQLSSISSIINK